MAMTNSFPVLNPPSDQENLQECRLQLLTSIRQLQATQEVSQAVLEAIHTKKAHYNRVVDSINELQATYHFDPIEKLPPELFTQIVHEVAFDGVTIDTTDPHEYIWGGGVVSSLTLVSQRWKELITSTPFFWTFIVLNENKPDSFSNASIFFQFSQQLPVAVYILYSVTMESSTTWEELLKHRDRIVHVTYQDMVHHMAEIERHDFKATFRNCMRNISPLPALKSLVYDSSAIDSDGPTIQYVLDLYPTLREFRAPKLPDNQIKCLMSRSCRSIDIHQSPEPLWPLLEANPSLREVNIYEDLSESSTSPIVTKPLNWERLSVAHLNLPLSIGITEKVTQLVELDVKGYFATFFRLLTNMHRLSRLQDLTLTLLFNGRMTITEDLPTSFPSNGVIQNLDLRLYFEWRTQSVSSEEDRTPIKPAEMQKVKEFGGLVIQTLPAIRELSLRFDNLPGISFFSEEFNLRKVNQLYHLQTLCIWSELRVDSSELPPCDTLEISHEKEKYLLRFSNRKVRHLKVRSPQLGDVGRNLRCRSWPSLETLTIPVRLISNTETGFPHLREKTLDPLDPGGINQFCRRLALYPSLCPVLDSLTFDECPDWDIFFIMFEKRLFWSARGTTAAFKSIRLPGYTPRYVLPHICEILQGRLPDRPSNFELSPISKAKTLLDKTCLQCIRCIRLGGECQSTSFKFKKCKPAKLEADWIKNLPKYPQNEDYILQAWKKRHKAWNKGVRLAIFRREQCPSDKRPIKLDPFTSLDDLFIDVNELPNYSY
ncbi:hypothetical protein CPB86DRAFT_869307 [Serendipita vermifera]|nr:hypothetical protein CPB86DRAFT_869307 [Serendipita vermifera]